MPTGYTNEIINNPEISFKQFALICAKAFGACASLRDEPLKEEIPEFTPLPYYPEMLKKAEDALEEFETVSIDKLKDKFETQMAENKLHYEREIAEKLTLKDSYDRILSQASAWVPPTENHDGLKDFMIDQIKKSVVFDCNISFYRDEIEKISNTKFSDWHESEFFKIKKNVEYYKEQYQKEMETVKRNNLWVKQLRDSL